MLCNKVQLIKRSWNIMKNFKSLECKYKAAYDDVFYDSPLSEWYRSVRNTEIELLGVGDICVAIRQSLFLDDILPVAAGILGEDIYVGENYDGEMVYSMLEVPEDYWNMHKNIANKIAKIIKNSKTILIGNDFSNALSKLLGRLS